jgi:hypothetical protein
MSKFIQTDEGMVNTDFVVSVHWVKAPTDHNKRGLRAVVQYMEGKSIATASAKYLNEDDLEKLSEPVVPAAPGYFIINVYDDEFSDGSQGEPFKLYSVPIVAWRISGDTAHPICADDEPCDGWAILDPTGRVARPFLQWWESSAEFRAARIEEKRKATAKKLAVESANTNAGKLTNGEVGAEPATTTGIRFSSYVAQGWTVEQMKTAGVIVADAKPMRNAEPVTSRPGAS